MVSVKKQIGYLGGLIFLATLTRLIPHPWNFTAIGAVTLLAGREFKDVKLALFVPFISLLVSDLFLGFHKTMFFTYGAMILVGLIASFCREWLSGLKIFGAAFFSSLIFFGVSNFGVWWVGNLYPHTWQGFTQCLFMALPFFKGQVMGDFFFTGALFLIWNRVRIANGWNLVAPNSSQ